MKMQIYRSSMGRLVAVTSLLPVFAASLLHKLGLSRMAPVACLHYHPYICGASFSPSVLRRIGQWGCMRIVRNVPLRCNAALGRANRNTFEQLC